MPVEHLGAVDVADAGEHRLVHEHRADRCAAARHAVDDLLRVGVLAQGVRAEPGEDRRAPVAPDQVARRRAAQVGVPGVVGQPQAHGAPRLRRRRGRAHPRAVEAEVHVQHLLALERHEQVLAVGLGLLQHAPVEQRGAGGEPALRARRLDRALPERARQAAREPVQAVALGHGAPRGRRVRRTVDAVARPQPAVRGDDEHPDDRALDRLADRGPSRVGVDGARRARDVSRPGRRRPGAGRAHGRRTPGPADRLLTTRA